MFKTADVYCSEITFFPQWCTPQKEQRILFFFYKEWTWKDEKSKVMKMYFLKLQLEVRSQDLKTNQKWKGGGKKEPKNRREENKKTKTKQKQKNESHECLRKLIHKSIPTTNHCITCQLTFVSLIVCNRHSLSPPCCSAWVTLHPWPGCFTKTLPPDTFTAKTKTKTKTA